MNSLLPFFFELGMMKKIEHCGLKFAGVKNPDSLADHSCRAAQIGYLLALEAEGNPEKVAAMCLYHDMGEIRIGDAHRIAQRYIPNLEKAEEKAMEEQTAPLRPAFQKRIRGLWKEFHAQETLDSQIARDADLLETMLEAKERLDTGYASASRWLENGHKELKTAAAKKLYTELMKSSFSDWWDRLNTV